MRRWMLRAVLCQFVLVGAADAAFPALLEGAQQPASKSIFRGRVVDSSSGAIVGAQVAVSPDRPGTPTTPVTNQQGEFELTMLPGSYVVRVSANGFVDRSRRMTLTTD